jgi:transketolase
VTAGAWSRSDQVALSRLADRCRQLTIEMIYLAGSGHLGSSLSCVDILTVLVCDQMDRRPGSGGDLFVLSKGHAAPAWYAAMMVTGELDPSLVTTLRTLDSPLQGHPDRSRLGLVAVSTGALGQGLSVALGRAEARRLRGQDSTVYCLLGDGELQEGQVWEAAMYAGARGLGNVVAVVDANGCQNDGPVTMPVAPGPAFSALGWHVQDVDGHAIGALRTALGAARRTRDRPSVVLARTVKGRLGPGRVLLNGAHSGVLSAEEFNAATAHLRDAP